jgi:diguanylate cyclase (GGDEF)-like protein
MDSSLSYTPLVLLIEDQEWTARSLESILSPHGYAVFKAYTGRQGLDIVHKMIPDLIMVDLQLPDMKGTDVLRELAEAGTVFPSTPRVLMSTSPVSREDRLEALEAGAWDILRPPLDPEELTSRFNTWARAKRDADQARDQGLVDPLTGLYNFNGLLRRIEELASDASRNERFISLVVVGPAAAADASRSHAVLDEAMARSLGSAFRERARLSDSIGRVGEGEFVMVAPGTDPDGAARMAERMLEAAEQASEESGLRAGVYSVLRSKREPVASLDLLSRATSALRRAQARSNGGTLVETYGDEED